jgi:UDP-2,4-diacetamido-2,4,6-trideoxy-beta-L-altropyranose hydrolase
MRCLTLAEHTIAAGWSVGFACSAETLAIVPALADRVELLRGSDSRSLDQAALAARWPLGCDVLVVDHYSLDACFEETCRGWARRIVVIDDLADRQHDCDLLIDSTLGRKAADYAGLVPADALVLAGVDYALLRPEFAARREESLTRRAALVKVERVLVSLGLSDLGGITDGVTRRLLDIDARFSIDVAIGPTAPSRAALEDLVVREPRLGLHIHPPDMDSLMAMADLAVGAGGTTSWERCCLGLPTLMLVVAENQEMIAKELARAGAVVQLKQGGRTDRCSLAKAFAELAANLERLHDMSASAAVICDGKGAHRVYDYITRITIKSNLRSIARVTTSHPI